MEARALCVSDSALPTEPQPEPYFLLGIRILVSPFEVPLTGMSEIWGGGRDVEVSSLSGIRGYLERAWNHLTNMNSGVLRGSTVGIARGIPVIQESGLQKC